MEYIERLAREMGPANGTLHVNIENIDYLRSKFLPEKEEHESLPDRLRNYRDTLVGNLELTREYPTD